MKARESLAQVLCEAEGIDADAPQMTERGERHPTAKKWECYEVVADAVTEGLKPTILALMERAWSEGRDHERRRDTWGGPRDGDWPAMIDEALR